jgi:putative ABC transport system permease protein
VSFADAAQFAWTALSRQRRRSVLSVLGVTVGVAAVVILTALGEGARRYVVQEFASLGTNLLIVPNDLTLDDAAALAREVREARLVVPISMGNETVSHGERRRQLIVVGTTHDFLEARELSVQSGRFLPRGEMERGTSVAVVGAKVVEELFAGESPLGRVMRIGDWRMRVIGVLEGKGHQIGIDLNDMVIVPVASGMRMFDQSSLFRILLKVSAHSDLERAKQRVLAVITERHDEEDVTCLTQESVVASLSNILTALTLAVAGIGVISLSVAGSA